MRRRCAAALCCPLHLSNARAAPFVGKILIFFGKFFSGGKTGAREPPARGTHPVIPMEPRDSSAPPCSTFGMTARGSVSKAFLPRKASAALAGKEQLNIVDQKEQQTAPHPAPSQRSFFRFPFVKMRKKESEIFSPSFEFELKINHYCPLETYKDKAIMAFNIPSCLPHERNCL